MTLDIDVLNARILIVDDHECNTEIFEMMLSQAGYLHVSSTMNPTEVCALHRAARFDLILLDLQMPVMDGFHVMEALKAMDPGRTLPVMALSAQPGHRPRALEFGAEDFVTKPFEVIEILDRIRSMIEARLQDREREISPRAPV